MNSKKLVILALVPLWSLSMLADTADKNPQKGDVTVAATLGYNSYTQLQAVPGNQNDYSLQAVSTNWSDKKLMVGIEGGWFFQDLWKLTLGGGLSFNTNPGYSPVPGTADEHSEPGDGSIPNYGAVAEQTGIQFNVFTGIDRYFHTKVSGLLPYLGFRAGYAYGRNTAKWDDETMMGRSIGESFNVRGAVTFGVDYFITSCFYCGAQVDPVAYTYNQSNFRPQDGLRKLAADSHNVSVLAAPTLKIGFKF